ncbi:MAG: DUF362 domain-containing protein [Methanomassiliicoccus sp.]|nr:DUF362 domain-containing protein [Methanomassiliicoccus sp.]
MSDVYFADLRADRASKNVPNKIQKLFRRAGLGSTFSKGDLVAVKTHFGEEGNTAYLRPELVSNVVDLVSRGGGKPFLTDCSTLYKGMRTNAVDHLLVAARHGFTYPVVNAPIVMADGLKGTDDVEIPVDLKHCRTVKIGAAAAHADSLMVVSHFKGHGLTGFGGALKNLGMGLGSRRGKMEMHALVRAKVVEERCKGCGRCVEQCPADAIEMIERKAMVDPEKCIGCGECNIICQNQGIDLGDWNNYIAVQERIVEYCYGILKDKKDRAGYMTFVLDVTPLCDCYDFNDAPIVPNIGILASRDIVAIDQAAADLVNAAPGLHGSALKNGLAPGDDKLRQIVDADWTAQLRYAEELGLGERSYDLIRVR